MELFLRWGIGSLTWGYSHSRPLFDPFSELHGQIQSYSQLLTFTSEVQVFF